MISNPTTKLGLEKLNNKITIRYIQLTRKVKVDRLKKIKSLLKLKKVMRI